MTDPNGCSCAPGRLMPVDEALDLLDRRTAVAVGIETVPLAEALGRVLARDVVSAISLPPCDNSAVDGYAVRLDDLSPDRDTRLPVTGRIAAGATLGRPARRGEAIRIFTGAAVPDGVDTVLMQEDCRAEGDRVTLPPWTGRGANVRRAGEDVSAGAVALRAGGRLRAQELGLAAAVGQPELAVRERLRVALFSTGDELREPGAPLPPGCIHDSNRASVRGLLEGLGCAVTDLGILADREEVVRAALAGASEGHDLIVTSGGVSTGEEDHVKAAVEALGGLHFWRLAIKPGKPIAMGEVNGVPFLGLPGNPVAAMVTFLVVARPMVLKLAGRADTRPRPYPVRAGFAFRNQPGRREYLRGRLEWGDDGVPRAIPFPSQGSGVLSSMTRSDGLIVVSEAVEVIAPGDNVPFLPFSALVG